jgi:hypothetical protein
MLTKPNLRQALIAVYGDLLSFYQQARTVLVEKKYAAEAPRARLQDIVLSFDRHVKTWGWAVNVETNEIARGLNAEKIAAGIAAREAKGIHEANSFRRPVVLTLS